jgi:hypothetical protein
VTTSDDTEPLIINGTPVDPTLLEMRASRRCALGECQAHCCGWGVSINVEQAHDILAHEGLILPHMPAERRDPDQWFDWITEPEYDHPSGGVLTNTTVVEDPTHPTGHNCIFLRSDRKCALQVAGVAAGEHPWRFKPFYCALHPLTFEKHELVLGEGNPLYIKGGSCNRPSSGDVLPVYQLFEWEVKLALGEAGYAELEARARKSANGRE